MRYVIIVLVERKCAGCTNKCLHFGETTYVYKDLTELHMRAVCSSAELRACWFYEYKTMTALVVRRMCIQNVTLKIHFPVPKCLCQQTTANVLNIYIDKDNGNDENPQIKHIKIYFCVILFETHAYYICHDFHDGQIFNFVISFTATCRSDSLLVVMIYHFLPSIFLLNNL